MPGPRRILPAMEIGKGKALTTRTNIMLPPEDTVRVWQERGALQPTMRWSEMMHEEHAAAFTVAKIARLDLLAAVQESLDDVIRNGGTFEQWKANVVPELQRAGWWGVVQDKSLTGTDDAIIVNDRRLQTIYRTNLRMSIAAGRWRKYQREKDMFPYLRYLSDHYRKHPRLNHQALHGVILPVDHPAWQWMFPPNGWGCNCRVEQVSEARMARNGWRVSEKADALAHPPTHPFTRPDGSVIDVPDQVQPGFGYNPGTAHLRAIADKAINSARQAIDHGLDRAAQSTIQDIADDPALLQFMAIPDARFPIAVLPEDMRESIGGAHRLVIIPSGVMDKQMGRGRRLQPEEGKAYTRGASEGHADIDAAHYRLLPSMFDRAIAIGRNPKATNSVEIIFTYEGQYFRAVVRQDGGQPLPKIVTLHRVLDDRLQPMLARMERL